ncbi:unnamed protein product [Arabis nemorensis]|uniref:Uncharacterized protein n=1 Tax=Arabis nemorensis TaxID=586526 RepID=A0A565CIL2_9BRAS|nr:unnamed protein product [Arabis nemorensis]
MRVNLAVQENPRSLPILLLELAIPTGKLLQDLGVGLIRIALECEKKPSEKTKIIYEPIWALYYNDALRCVDGSSCFTCE